MYQVLKNHLEQGKRPEELKLIIGVEVSRQVKEINESGLQCEVIFNQHHQ